MEVSAKEQVRVCVQGEVLVWELESSHLAQRSLRLPAPVLEASLSALAVHDDGSLFLGDEQGTVWRLQVCREPHYPHLQTSTYMFMPIPSCLCWVPLDCTLTPHLHKQKRSGAEQALSTDAGVLGLCITHTDCCQCDAMSREWSVQYAPCLGLQFAPNMQLLSCCLSESALHIITHDGCDNSKAPCLAVLMFINL